MKKTSRDTFYVTTPIYYVTAKPHLGSLYSTLLADVLARWNKLQGKKVFFLTGTDEHGQKVAQAAENAGKDPQEFVDSFIPAYKNVWRDYHIDYNYFIRTTDKEHVAAVQQWIRDLQKKGDIYKSFYTGWYCTPCETFVTEKDLDSEQKNKDAGPLCPECGRSTQHVSEETYCFKLSEYQDKLLEFYEKNPDFIMPRERAKEVINFVQSGLKDLSISRTTVSWGIPFPDDDKHVAYVWADALNNYITAIGYGQKNKQEIFNTWWPADIQVLGKDIVRFHAVYWPAFLMASGLQMPHQLLVHGWLKIDKQKMSKSLGNVIDPVALCDAYGADQVRYYLTRYMSIAHDSDFTIADLEQSITSDLANDLGNLLNRMVTLAKKNNLEKIIPPHEWSKKALELRDECWAMVADFETAMNECLFHRALARLWNYINKINAYFHASAPWKLAKTDSVAFAEVIAVACHGLRAIATLLWPVMPAKMEELLKSIGSQYQLGNDRKSYDLIGKWDTTFTLTQIPTLFVKFESKKDDMQEIKQEEKVNTDLIDIDHFAAVKLVVGQIEACEEVEKSDKLLKQQVNFGEHGTRQILSGIKKFFTPQDLVGKKVVYVLNLKPRKMMGMESQGMMLMANKPDGTLSLVSVDQDVEPGTQLS